MARKEFPRSVKVAAVKRATLNGEVICELYGCMTKGRFELDHIKECFYGGEPTLQNLQVLCVPCHSEKTNAGAADRSKTLRREAKALGIKGARLQSKRTFQRKDTGSAGSIRNPSLKIGLPPRRSLYEDEL